MLKHSPSLSTGLGNLEIRQGSVTSCQTLAAIGALGLNPAGHKHLQKLVREIDDGYEVSFPACESTNTIKVSKAELGDDSNHVASAKRQYEEQTVRALTHLPYSFVRLPLYRVGHVSGHPIVQVLELAYARFLLRQSPSQFADLTGENDLLIYSHPKFHYHSGISLKDLSGWRVESIVADESDDPDHSGSFETEVGNHPDVQIRLENLLESLANSPLKFVATACTVGYPQSRFLLDPGDKLRPWHDHILRSIDSQSGSVEVIDPLNSRITMRLWIEDFCKYFNIVSLAAVP